MEAALTRPIEHLNHTIPPKVEACCASGNLTQYPHLASLSRDELSLPQLTAEILNDQGRFMTQDDFVLYASGGDLKNVRKGLAEKRLCSVKGSHKEKVMCTRPDLALTTKPLGPVGYSA